MTQNINLNFWLQTFQSVTRKNDIMLHTGKCVTRNERKGLKFNEKIATV